MAQFNTKNLLQFCSSIGSVVSVRKADGIIDIKLHLKADLAWIVANLKRRFNVQQLTDIVATHHDGLLVQATYLFVSPSSNTRLKVITFTKTNLIRIVDWFPGGGWIERELWDMYGVACLPVPNRKARIEHRIFTDYGFKGHPLRKEFPESGWTEVLYDEKAKRVITVANQIRVTRQRK